MPLGRNTKKYSCCFCSSLDKIGKNKIVFCKDCKKIRDYIRDFGLDCILSIIKKNNITATAPAYNTL